MLGDGSKSAEALMGRAQIRGKGKTGWISKERDRTDMRKKRLNKRLRCLVSRMEPDSKGENRDQLVA